MITTDNHSRRASLRDILAYAMAAISLAAAITAIFIALFIPPEGEVHSSVLTYFGISCAFCGSLLGISAHFSNELTRFKSEITSLIKNPKS